MTSEPSGVAESNATYPRPRRRATVKEAKALAHPLRGRILRLCAERELTNQQLAQRLSSDPATVLYHVRLLVDAGLLQPAGVRTGERGALEKPYRSTGVSWWLDDPLADALARGGNDSPSDVRLAPLEAFAAELGEAGPQSIATQARFVLHLSPAQVAELDRRLLAVLDEYVETDDERLDQPAHGGIVIVHRLSD